MREKSLWELVNTQMPSQAGNLHEWKLEKYSAETLLYWLLFLYFHLSICRFSQVRKSGLNELSPYPLWPRLCKLEFSVASGWTFSTSPATEIVLYLTLSCLLRIDWLCSRELFGVCCRLRSLCMDLYCESADARYLVCQQTTGYSLLWGWDNWRSRTNGLYYISFLPSLGLYLVLTTLHSLSQTVGFILGS